ncbi:MAG: hypothetical protein DRI84_04700 [Bacteroidetes bacterium]|nr:MAG: hypothetical protein DRI84_04700 [Bacteroidota bacterium]
MTKTKLSKRRNKIKKLMRYHKYPALIFSLFIVFFALSGIVMNHRILFSKFSVDRDWLGQNYQYRNWNMSSLKSVLVIDSNTNILYGNVGMWRADSNFENLSRFDQGIPETVDQRKIGVMFEGQRGDLFAGGLFGLYHLNTEKQAWEEINLPTGPERIYSILENRMGFFVMGRNHIFHTENSIAPYRFEVVELKEPENYDNKVGLFQTFWQIHNGDIIGMTGRIIMDIVALLFIFLTLTGIYHWVAPRRMKSRRLANKDYERIKRWKRGTKAWHNKLGNWFLILLIISTLTGMFLRPPLLIAIASSKVAKIPFTHLDNPNAWHDRLRALFYDEAKSIFLIGTPDGIYSVDENFEKQAHYFKHQAPISVMGINQLSKLNEKEYLVGGFLGLFRWNPFDGETIDYITGETGVVWDPNAKPLSDKMVGGYFKKANGNEYYFDFNNGATNIKHREYFSEMTEQVLEESPMSLWNFAQETHTGRIYRFMFGSLYILFIPLSGMAILMLLIVGWRLERKLYTKPKM